VKVVGGYVIVVRACVRVVPFSVIVVAASVKVSPASVITTTDSDTSTTVILVKVVRVSESGDVDPEDDMTVSSTSLRSQLLNSSIPSVFHSLCKVSLLKSGLLLQQIAGS
jgi:hypothetical protein